MIAQKYNQLTNKGMEDRKDGGRERDEEKCRTSRKRVENKHRSRAWKS